MLPSAAIGAYYDFESPSVNTPSMSFVEDVTIGEGESVPPDTLVEVGGLLGVTQQLSSFETEFNTQPQRNVQGDFNPFASPQKNKHDATDSSFRDPGGAWEPTQEPIQQDQNGLSHNAVNRASNGLQTNLSVVTYGQVWMC
ncbi:hypothetical protein GOODEAATRI_008143, partial [Goodea atripinnis]